MSVSKLFNFSSLLTENTFDLAKKVDHSDNLHKGLSIMKEFDSSVQENTRNLYSALLEAESKKSENACFGQFYVEYKKALNKVENEMREVTGRFYVNIETFIDAHLDVFDKQCCAPENTTFHAAQFNNLLSDDIPNIDPYKAFKKEWALLGRLLQDLDPTAPEEERTKIITSVYNSLSKEINDGWLDKCVEKIADSDDCNKDNFAKIIYDKFVSGGDVEITLDIPTVEQAKLSLKNYTNYTECIQKSADNFCDGIAKIANELGSMLFRNMDKKLEIKTDEEGVADASYRMNDYSMNQVNLFLTTKMSQIRELTNLYTIALSIKMDCIFKYLKQCVAIIEAASSCCAAKVDDSNPDISGAPEDNSGEMSVDDEDNDIEELPTDKTNEPTPEPEGEEPVTEPEGGEEPAPGDLEANPEDEPDGIENNTPVTGGEEGETEPEAIEDETDPAEEENPTEESYISAAEEAAYLFEAEIALLQRYANYQKLNREYIKEADEEVQPAGDETQTDDSNKSAAPLQATDEVAAKGNSFLSKVKNNINAIKDSYNKTYSTQIKFISDHKNDIMSANIPDGWTIQKYNMALLSGIKFPAFNMADAELYKDRAAFLKAKYGKYTVVSADQKTVIACFLAKCYSDKETKFGDAERNEGYNYIVKEYKAAIDSLSTEIQKVGDFYNKEYDKYMASKKKAKNESADLNSYFTEDFTGVDEASGDVDTNKRFEAVTNWFVICAQVCTSVNNIHIRNFKKQYAFLKKLSSMSNKDK